MASYLSLKMKRKELEEVNDDFSDFSLSSPARKIRRLDAELPPIMEEDENDVLPDFEPSMPEKRVESVGEEVYSVPFNKERAIVLFKPVNSPLMLSSPKYSVSVDSDIISGFKNQFPWSSETHLRKLAEDEATIVERGGRSTDECLAVVPWVPSHVPQASGVEEVPEMEALELEGVEDTEATSMDIEGNNINPEREQEHGFGASRGSESLHQWQQQHCMAPQLPQNASTPITWFR